MDQTVDRTKLPSMSEIQFPNLNVNEDILNLNSSQISAMLNPLNLQELNEAFMLNQNDLNEYYFTNEMENGKIVDLNLPQTLEKDQENHYTCTTGSVKSSPTGIMPCQDEFGGSLNFEVYLDSSSEAYRQKWNYSVKLQKVFIDINKVLLLNFKFDYQSSDCEFPIFVRAMPMYSAADFLKVPVDRCYQHLSPVDILNKGCDHIKHIIRCDNENTIYHEDKNSLRKSVVTHLKPPEYGSDCCKLSYRFVCKTSCAGGMERRPIIVIFTLEDQNQQVLGRRILPVKICACPKRDMEREENDTKIKKNTVLRRYKRCISSGHHHHQENDIPCKHIKTEPKTPEEKNDQENCTYSLSPLNYTTKNKKHYKIILEGFFSSAAGLSLLHNLDDTQPLIDNLKAMLNDLN